MADNFKNFIAGEWVAPTTGAYFENRNPADWNEVIGCFPRSGPDDVARAVAAAQRGFARWSKTPAPIRGDVLHRVGDLLVQRKDEIARAMTREMGKVLAETRGDVQEGIDTAYYAHTEGRRLFGRTVPSELRDKWAMSYRRPIGIAGLITPFNFPLAIPTWKMFPALLCGDAVIFKPAEDVPLTAHLLVEVLLEAGLPPEVVPAVHGEGSGVGRPQEGGILRGRGGRSRGAAPDRRRPARRQAAGAWLVLPAHGAGGGPPGDARRAGGDLRAGARRDRGRLARRGDPRQQRRAVRPLELAVHARRERGVPSDDRAGQRDHVRERAHDRRGSAPAVRRRKADGQWPPRRRLGGVRLLFRDQSRVRRLFREAAARADRHGNVKM